MDKIKNQSVTIVGVLNVTPNSFSDGRRFLNQGAALAHAQELVAAGARIIDVGGESTAPGSKPMSAEDELSRIFEIVGLLAPQVRLSIDTYHAKTARACLERGAKMINDVSALRADAEMVHVVKEFNVPVVIMFSKEEALHPHATDRERSPGDIIEQVKTFFSERVEYALSHGVTEQQIILDPGSGRFVSNDPNDSWELLLRLDELKQAFPSFPLYVGISRKGFLGGELSARDPLSQLASLAAIRKGASFVRTHNVKMMVQFIQTWQRLF